MPPKNHGKNLQKSNDPDWLLRKDGKATCLACAFVRRKNSPFAEGRIDEGEATAPKKLEKHQEQIEHEVCLVVQL
jgi:hypothetical protein